MGQGTFTPNTLEQSEFVPSVYFTLSFFQPSWVQFCFSRTFNPLNTPSSLAKVTFSLFCPLFLGPSHFGPSYERQIVFNYICFT